MSTPTASASSSPQPRLPRAGKNSMLHRTWHTSGTARHSRSSLSEPIQFFESRISREVRRLRIPLASSQHLLNRPLHSPFPVMKRVPLGEPISNHPSQHSTAVCAKALSCLNRALRSSRVSAIACLLSPPPWFLRFDRSRSGRDCNLAGCGRGSGFSASNSLLLQLPQGLI